MRVFFMLIAVACIGLAYLLGRDVSRSRFAGVASAAALLSFHGVIELATYGPREKTPMVCPSWRHSSRWFTRDG